MANNTVSALFTEQLRPQTLDQVLLVDRVRKQLQNELNSEHGIISNLLFYGTQGAGKTTLSRIICKGHDTKVINCSAVGIDAVREDIQTFASQMSLEHPDNPIKIVLLEECDGFTTEAWKAMRATVERFSENVRFVANCNYIEKVPAPIQSRFTCIQLEPINADEKTQLMSQYIQRTSNLLTRLGISFNEEVLENMILETFPDYRSVLNKVQQLFISGAKELNSSTVATACDYTSLFNLILSSQPNPYQTYLSVRDEFGDNVDGCIAQIAQKFPEYLQTNYPTLIGKLPLIIIATAEHQDMLLRAINRNLVLQSLIFKIQTILGN